MASTAETLGELCDINDSVLKVIRLKIIQVLTR
jgi:hypothetical protein